MPGKHKPIIPEQSSWREYQKKLQKDASNRNFYKKIIPLLILVLICSIAVYGVAKILHKSFRSYFKNNTTLIDPQKPQLLGKNDIRKLLKEVNLVNMENQQFDFTFGLESYQAQTSLDISLQNRLLKAMDRVNSRYIGIVALDPDTGIVKIMASFDKTGHKENQCVSNHFPAASIFKIITAAAAVEKCGYNANSILKFNGYKHTLYKSQLKDKSNRYTNRVSFKNSFAQSINPVFGKIGCLYLKKNILENYARAFGFNDDLNFEIPVAPSHIQISEKPYHWAEIACGFNRQTTISPLHGAMIAASVLNNGRLVEPTIIRQVINAKGKIIYKSKTAIMGQAIDIKTAKIIDVLMQTTIKSGTGYKSFKGYKRDKVLSRLKIGGKTGSIYNKSHDAKFDWFVGFAGEKDGPGSLAIAVVVAHEKFIGKRAAQYARLAIKHYFKTYFANNRSPVNPG